MKGVWLLSVRILAFAVLVVGPLTEAKAQLYNLHSTSRFTHTRVNPAFFHSEKTQLLTTSRYQQLGLGTTQNYGVILTGSIRNKRLGVGGGLFHERFEKFRLSGLSVLANYKLQDRDWSFRFGLSGRIMQIDQGYSNLLIKDEFDELLDQDKVWSVPFQAGVYYCYKKTFVSFSVNDLNPSKVSSSSRLDGEKWPRHFYLLGGIKHEFSGSIAVTPTIAAAVTDRGEFVVDLQPFFFFLSTFWVAPLYRTNGDVELGLGVDLSTFSTREDPINLGISFGNNMAPATQEIQGRLVELNLIWVPSKRLDPEEILKYDQFPSPVLFQP